MLIGIRPFDSVLPTRVGMVRAFACNPPPLECSPHARGDGPTIWNGSSNGRCVLPTRVGMVRPCAGVPLRARCSPHARGDGPRSRYWNDVVAQVLPTRVGMVRDSIASRSRYASSPHARGDGPRAARFSRADWFSPRAWGWSGVSRRADLCDVLPTRVGMVRSSSPIARSHGVLPTRVGMVRCALPMRLAALAFSPRAWGWSGAVEPRSCRESSPHARGDGPYAREHSCALALSSPHARGDGPAIP